LGVQALGSAVVLVYSFTLSYAIGWIIEKTMGFRVRNEDELAGIDTLMHGEEGYVLTSD
jgi:Amt family ammonium transporter